MEAIVPYKTMALQDVMTVGEILAKSGFFQDSRDMAQAVTKILAGNELGIGPVAAMTGIYIVKGRVALSANLIAAAIKRSGKYDYKVLRLDASGCELEFYEGNKAIGKSAFTDDDAKAAGLGGDNWNKYRRNMHFARAMSNGAKWYCPDVFSGPVYTPDELTDNVTMDDNGDVIDVKPEPARSIPVQVGGFTQAGTAAQEIIQRIAPMQAQKPARPADAATVRKTVRHHAGWPNGERVMAGEPITPGQKTSVLSLTSEAVLLPGMTEAEIDNARHALLDYLFGVQSTSLLMKREASSIIKWLKVDTEGQWDLNDYARAEAAAVLAAWQVEQGQAELFAEVEAA